MKFLNGRLSVANGRRLRAAQPAASIRAPGLEDGVVLPHLRKTLYNIGQAAKARLEGARKTS
jgi:hypothetical protein